MDAIARKTLVAELNERIQNREVIHALLQGRVIAIPDSTVKLGYAKELDDGRIELVAEIHFWNPSVDEMHALSSGGGVNWPEQSGWSHPLGLKMAFDPSALILLEHVNLT